MPRPLTLESERAAGKSFYFYGATGSRFSAQIGESTNAGLFVWTIFHSDFKFAVYGGEVSSADQAKSAAQDWLDFHAKPLEA